MGILFGQGTVAFFSFLPGYAATHVLRVTPLAIIFGWLYENTGRSLLAVFLVHNSFNQTSTTVGSMFPDAPVMLGIIAFLWIMVIVILVTRDWRAFGRARKRRVRNVLVASSEQRALWIAGHAHFEETHLPGRKAGSYCGDFTEYTGRETVVAELALW